MTGIDESFQVVRRAVVVMRGKQIDSVISPAPASRKFGNGHHFDMRNAERYEMVKLLDCSQECTVRSKGADVQFINNAGGKRQRVPLLVGPLEKGVDNTRWAVNSIRLPGGPRVGN